MRQPLRVPALSWFVPLLALLCACTADVPVPGGPPKFAFREAEPFRLPVAALEIEMRYVPPNRPPNVEHTYSVSPADIARAWARDRIVLNGTAGRVRVIIREASVIEEGLPTQGGLRGYLTTEQDRKLTARLRVELVIEEARGTGRANAEATSSRTLPETANISAVEVEYYGLLDQLARNFDAQMSSQLGGYLVGL